MELRAPQTRQGKVQLAGRVVPFSRTATPHWGVLRRRDDPGPALMSRLGTPLPLSAGPHYRSFSNASSPSNGRWVVCFPLSCPAPFPPAAMCSS